MPRDLPAGFEIVAAAVLGAMIGSFLNVCILRWGSEPKQSVVTPRSRCPRCGKGLAWHDNIPVISWLLLRARCRECREPISVQYPLIELATAAIWGYMAWRHGIALETLRGAIFGTILLGIAMTDAREYIIPHEFSIGGTLVAIALAAWPDPTQALVSVQGALAGAGAVLLIGELSGLALGQEAMGGGDCALMGMIGAFLGWEAIFPVLLTGALISTVLFLLTSMWSRTAPSIPSDPEPEPASVPSFRWRLVARLFAVGMLPILVVAASVALGLVGDVLNALFYGLLGAGLAYYASFLLPAGVYDRWWARVIGLVAAAVAMSVGAGLSAIGVVLGLVIGMVALWEARRGRLVASPATTQGLHSQGYLPFGVGLALAAGVLLFSGAMPLVRDVVLEYSRFLRLA